jgi:hypothetical protein
LELPAGSPRLWTRAFLEWTAIEYWRVITRWTLGLIRVRYDGEDQCVVLVARPLTLLRFHEPEFELTDDRGVVSWRIKRGILVAQNGRESGFLALSIARIGSGASGRPRVRMELQVRNFYPWLRGTGWFAAIGVWIYAQTQQRIHRAVSRRFLRRVAASVARA